MPVRAFPTMAAALALAAAASAAEAGLLLPETVDPGETVRVAIDPPLADAGLLVLVPVEGPAGGERVAGEPLMALPVQAGAAAAEFAAPLRPGSYRLGLEGTRRRDRAFVEVAAVPLRLSVPLTVPAAEPMEIGFSAPPGARLAMTDADGATVLAGIAIDPGLAAAGRVQLAAPALSGRYAVAILDPGSGAVLARRSFAVEASRAWFRAPAVVRAGEALEVERFGPGGAGHALLIRREADGVEVGRWPLTGSDGARGTETLRAPSRAGRYRLVYLSLADGEVLSEAPLVVQR